MVYIAGGAAAIGAIIWHELHPGAVREQIGRVARWERRLWEP